MYDFTGKVALVTGAASGIGLAYVRELLSNGCKGVALLDINEELGISVTGELKKEFGEDRVVFFKVNVTSSEQLENAFEETVKLFQQLDIVINNAGINDEADFQKAIAVNFTAVVHGTKLALEKYFPKYKSGEEGIVVNTSSMAALVYYPDFPVYSSTKLAMIMLSKSLCLRKQYKNFRILTICPGATKTPLYDYAVNHLMDIEEALKATNVLEAQSSDVLGKALIHVINEGKSGSVWYVNDGKPANEIAVDSALKVQYEYK